MKKSTIKKYARLIVRIGANVQKGQSVVVSCAVEQADFCAMVVDECYRAGARYVTVNWSNDKITRLKYRNESLRTLSNVLTWQEEKMKWMAEELPCRIHIVSEDPDGLKGINPSKMQKVQVNNYKVMKKYSDAMESRHQWTIATTTPSRYGTRSTPTSRLASRSSTRTDSST